MRKIVNFRASFFVAIGLILGIFSYYEFLFGDYLPLIVSLIVLFAIGVLLFVLKSKTWIGVAAVIFSVLIGFFMTQLNLFLREQNEAVAKEVVICGRVTDLNRNGTESGAYYLEDCVDSDGVSYGGRIETYIFNAEYSVGDVLTLKGTLNSVYPIKGQIEGYYLRPNIRYELQAESVVDCVSGEMKLDETIRKYIYDTASSNAPKNGDVLYALLTGDRSAMSAEKVVYFKTAGIIHVLAVSGLHVGFITAIIGFILKRFKLYPLLECVILLVPLLFYAYVCDFAPSIIRAVVMVVCTYLARAAFGRYDLLSSLSWAVIVLLLISPLNLFDVGFQLSVLSVYGIATVYSAFNRFLSKRRIPKIVKYFINSLLLSVSCSTATFFVLQSTYGYAPVLGILLNVAVIPFVAIAFAVGWIGMLPWIFHYVSYLSDWILEAIVISAKWVSELSFATVCLPAIAVSVVVVALWLFVLGGYVNLRKVGKIVVNSALAALLILCVGLSFVKLNPQTQFYVSYGYNDIMCVAMNSYGEAAIVGDFSDEYAYAIAANHLSKYNVKDCYLYIVDYSEADDDIITDALEYFPVSGVYKLNFAHNAVADEIFAEYGITVIQQMQNTSCGNGIVVTSVYDGGLRAVIMRSESIVVTSVYGDEYDAANYLDIAPDSSVYVLNDANKAYSDKKMTTLSRYQSQLPFNYGANKYGTFTIVQKGDTINIKFR